MKQRNLRAGDMALIGMFAALMAVGANITSMAPFCKLREFRYQPRPFFCLLAAMLLGARRATIAMTVYALAGLAGAPVFAQFSAGFAPFIGKSGGFILAYIPAAFATGWSLEKQKPGRLHYAWASLIGTAVIYIIGTTYTYIALKLWLHAPISYGMAWFYMIWFFIKDIVLALLLASIAPAVYRSIHKATGFSRNPA
ncbi:biotin transporter BioY [Bacillus velezensis]|nr:biotin transporter BioY [Bacillus velezensis]